MTTDRAGISFLGVHSPNFRSWPFDSSRSSSAENRWTAPDAVPAATQSMSSPMSMLNTGEPHMAILGLAFLLFTKLSRWMQWTLPSKHPAQTRPSASSFRHVTDLSTRGPSSPRHSRSSSPLPPPLPADVAEPPPMPSTSSSSPSLEEPPPVAAADAAVAPPPIRHARAPPSLPAEATNLPLGPPTATATVPPPSYCPYSSSSISSSPPCASWAPSALTSVRPRLRSHR
mmetsp:Transcript_15819/g.45579  ORF Transcript_15819/g.45579 Transcript_15819/m.45579 type:complete len:229 (+) Transcript_15819:1808-2494(+)